MGRKRDVSSVDELTLRQAEADLNGIPAGKVSKRLLAIIAVGNQKTLIETADLIPSCNSKMRLLQYGICSHNRSYQIYVDACICDVSL